MKKALIIKIIIGIVFGGALVGGTIAVVKLFNDNEELKNKIVELENNTTEETTTIENTTEETSNGIEPTTTKKKNTNTNNQTNTNQSGDTSNGIYLLKFNLDGGQHFVVPDNARGFGKTTTTSNYSISYNNDTKLSDNLKRMPSAYREKYILSGWYTEKNCGGAKVDSDTLLNYGSNKEIYACWKDAVKFSVSCNTQSESCGSYSTNVIKGSSIKDALKNESININDFIIKDSSNNVLNQDYIINSDISITINDK